MRGAPRLQALLASGAQLRSATLLDGSTARVGVDTMGIGAATRSLQVKVPELGHLQQAAADHRQAVAMGLALDAGSAGLPPRPASVDFKDLSMAEKALYGDADGVARAVPLASRAEDGFFLATRELSLYGKYLKSAICIIIS